MRGKEMKKEVSMKPTEKRNVLVKQMLRPLLKSRGFQSSGNTWWRELKDGWLIIHMQNSRWNGSATGANFNFQISVSSKNEIVDKLKNQWRHNLINDLCGTDFLPYCGYLSPHMTPFGYQIDGYRNGMPSDDPLDEFIEQVRGDFETLFYQLLTKYGQ
ncbi:MAG: DUF4304 domain-containing protein [Lachnospiraceae bacterium]|nr:DUF4304 domain-containing protein [Lachnospiraceae bacterium]